MEMYTDILEKNSSREKQLTEIVNGISLTH